MARRYRLLRKGTTASEAARIVAQNWSSARANVQTWATNYIAGINGADIGSFQSKLARWYDSLMMYRGTIAQAYAQIKARYYGTPVAPPAVTPAR